MLSMTPIPVLDSIPAGAWASPVSPLQHSAPSDKTLLHRILRDNSLHVVFQPVLDMHGRKYMGYEALIRGPQDSPLHSPAALFEAARQANLRRELEHACRAAAIREFARFRAKHAQDCKLFINLSASMLGDPVLMHDDMLQSMAEQGLRPDQIVIEITENQKVTDFSVFREVLARYRRLGYSFAIDDLGEGFSNLRMWSEIRPEFVKIDRHFISGIDSDVLKFRLVRAMVEIAEACHATLIAEGIEEESEFATIRDLGIRCGQGYLICRPQANPAPEPSPAIMKLLDAGRITVFPQGQGNAQCATVAPLLKHVIPVAPDLDNDTVFARFEAEPELHALPVVESGRPVGMINRHMLIERFARLYQRELYGKRPCSLFMDAHPMVAECDMSISEAGAMLGTAKRHQLYDGLILTEQGRYAGVADTQDLMVQISEMQMRSARYANPLTQLPGNVPVSEHMVRLLENNAPFVACYVDIDHFKPYNDAYGYRRGDEIIQLLGNILTEASDERIDFVGHIGGDDFILLMQSSDWQERCHSLAERFSAEALRYIDEEDLTRGGLSGEDRRGNPTFHALPTLSIGCIMVEPSQYASHNEIAACMADAKKQAKKQAGNSLFIERRKPARPVTAV